MLREGVTLTGGQILWVPQRLKRRDKAPDLRGQGFHPYRQRRKLDAALAA